MDMIFISSYSHKMNPIVSILYLQANIFQMFLYIIREYWPSIFCWTDKVINKIAYIVAQDHKRALFFFHRITISCNPIVSQEIPCAAELRGNAKKLETAIGSLLTYYMRCSFNNPKTLFISTYSFNSVCFFKFFYYI